MDTSFPQGGGRFPMVEVSTMTDPDTDCSWMHRPVYGQQPRNTSHQRTRIRSHTQSHAPLAAEAYGSDSPGCIRQLHCNVLHQQARLNMVNTAVQTDQEATPHVSGQPNSTLDMTHPRAILNVLADILSRPSQMSGTIWSLHPHVFRAREWGIPLLDLFATRWNHILPLFVSPVSDPSTMAVEGTVAIRIPTTSSVTTGAREGPTEPV